MTAVRSISDRPLIWPRLQARRRLLFWIGCAMSLLGAVAIVSPGFTHLLIGAFAGWLLWLAGGIMFGASLLLIGGRPFLGGLLSSLVAIGAGAFLLFNPTAGALAVTILATAVFVADGAFQLALALDLRPLKVWRWILASALASAVAAVMIAPGQFAGSTTAFGILVGVAVLSTGLGFIALSEAAGKD
ncbi:DUF308 domain-containing protein [Phenylobacterium sp. LH3H17]|uniref:HdeD family acid-resistance protein n=1 Tax=Phenylobacterium sp. LH3H17 TaxID=2903901 RepID=UPI0020C9A151|nr:DUF308 domain-containing protein [Phenylobacterium sp. LH3H17]UTP41124.1 DUF308 domain-containing protein [Phenylobacterium sp. LH3H17]